MGFHLFTFTRLSFHGFPRCLIGLRRLDETGKWNRLSDDPVVSWFSVVQWLTWPGVLGLSDDSPGGYIIAYLSYVLWALGFASLAAVLVRMFAPYASGGGIPEVGSQFLHMVKKKKAKVSTRLQSRDLITKWAGLG